MLRRRIGNINSGAGRLNKFRENIETLGDARRVDPHGFDSRLPRDGFRQRPRPSGGYTTQAYYQSMLGGEAMTARRQAYADQEGELVQLGYLSELGGDFALGHMFYNMAYGVTPPPSASYPASGERGLGPSSVASIEGGSSDMSDAGSSDVSDGGSPGVSNGSSDFLSSYRLRRLDMSYVHTFERTAVDANSV